MKQCVYKVTRMSGNSQLPWLVMVVICFTLETFLQVIYLQ